MFFAHSCNHIPLRLAKALWSFGHAKCNMTPTNESLATLNIYGILFINEKGSYWKKSVFNTFTQTGYGSLAFLANLSAI